MHAGSICLDNVDRLPHIIPVNRILDGFLYNQLNQGDNLRVPRQGMGYKKIPLPLHAPLGLPSRKFAGDINSPKRKYESVIEGKGARNVRDKGIIAALPVRYLKKDRLVILKSSKQPDLGFPDGGLDDTAQQIPVIKCHNIISPRLGYRTNGRGFAIPSRYSPCLGNRIPREFRVALGLMAAPSSDGEYDISVECGHFTLTLAFAVRNDGIGKKSRFAIGTDNYLLLRSRNDDYRSDTVFLHCTSRKQQSKQEKKSFQVGVSFSDGSAGEMIIGQRISLNQLSSVTIEYDHTFYDVVGILNLFLRFLAYRLLHNMECAGVYVHAPIIGHPAIHRKTCGFQT
jgi:hypothetical protein